MCVAAKDGKLCEKMTYEQNQAAPLSILYVFFKESSKKKPGERDWKDKAGMTRQLRVWANSSIRQEIQASGKSFKAILIRFGGEKKQMHSATMEWLWQQLQLLDFTFFFFWRVSFTESWHCKPKPACTSHCVTSSPSNRSCHQSLPQPAKWTLRQRQNGRGRKKGTEGGWQMNGWNSAALAISSGLGAIGGRAGSEPIHLHDRQQLFPGNSAQPLSSAAHKARLQRREGSSTVWWWS